MWILSPNKNRGNGKLYPELPDSIVPVILTLAITLLMLYFESVGKDTTNPVILFTIPFFYVLILTGTVGYQNILNLIGLRFKTTSHAVIAVLFIPFGWGVGWAIAKFATSSVGASILPVALYPFNMASTADVGTFAFTMLSMTPAVAFWTFLVVGTFEELYRLLFGQMTANWFYGKFTTNRVLASIVGFIVGSGAWAAMHWFAYRGFANPYLYISAIILGIIFYSLGWIAGIWADKEVSAADVVAMKVARFVPYIITGAISAHVSYDYYLVLFMQGLI